MRYIVVKETHPVVNSLPLVIRGEVDQGKSADKTVQKILTEQASRLTDLPGAYLIVTYDTETKYGGGTVELISVRQALQFGYGVTPERYYDLPEVTQ